LTSQAVHSLDYDAFFTNYHYYKYHDILITRNQIEIDERLQFFRLVLQILFKKNQLDNLREKEKKKSWFRRDRLDDSDITRREQLLLSYGKRRGYIRRDFVDNMKFDKNQKGQNMQRSKQDIPADGPYNDITSFGTFQAPLFEFMKIYAEIDTKNAKDMNKDEMEKEKKSIKNDQNLQNLQNLQNENLSTQEKLIQKILLVDYYNSVLNVPSTSFTPDYIQFIALLRQFNTHLTPVNQNPAILDGDYNNFNQNNLNFEFGQTPGNTPRNYIPSTPRQVISNKTSQPP
jgi:hypothetical protein